MNIFNKKNIKQKIIIVFTLVIIFNCVIPLNYTNAIDTELFTDPGNFIGKAFCDVMILLPKGIIKLTQKFILGTDAFDDDGSPNIALTPGLIFSNKVPILDSNFINPKKSDDYKLTLNNKDYTYISDHASTSMASRVSDTIKKWYNALRYIAIVGLLIVLVYIGIKILLSTTSEKKAKYKQMLIDWVVALILVIFMQLIMAAITMITDEITDMLANTTINYQVDGNNICDYNAFEFYKSAVLSEDLATKFGNTFMFFVLIIFTLIGLNMILEGRKEQKKAKYMKLSEMLLFGFAVSIDSFSVGIGINNISNNFFICSIFFSLTSLIFTYLGLRLGKKLNQLIGKIATIIGGIVLIILGIIFAIK